MIDGLMRIVPPGQARLFKLAFEKSWNPAWLRVGSAKGRWRCRCDAFLIKPRSRFIFR